MDMSIVSGSWPLIPFEFLIAPFLVPALLWLPLRTSRVLRPHLGALALLPLALSAVASAVGAVTLVRSFPIHNAAREPIITGAWPALLVPAYRGAAVTALLCVVVLVLSFRRSHSWSPAKAFGVVPLVFSALAVILSAGVVLGGLPYSVTLPADALYPRFVFLLRGTTYAALALCVGLALSAARRGTVQQSA